MGIGDDVFGTFPLQLSLGFIQRLILTRSLPLVSPFGSRFRGIYPRLPVPPVFLFARALALVAAQVDLSVR
jgi:hypothetical protein